MKLARCIPGWVPTLKLLPTFKNHFKSGFELSCGVDQEIERKHLAVNTLILLRHCTLLDICIPPWGNMMKQNCIINAHWTWWRYVLEKITRRQHKAEITWPGFSMGNTLLVVTI
jgi:hypothetical protein